MSIIFGTLLRNRSRIDYHALLKRGEATHPWAPHGTFVRAKERIGMGVQPYYTHDRSRLDAEPVEDEFGNLVSLDGRLDNHRALRDELCIESDDLSDTQIMLAAFARWGEQSFAKFIGDWALALWSETKQRLYLARDHAGTRSLYFEASDGEIRWSTFLETLLNHQEARPVDEVYLAAFLQGEPLGDRTPYRTVRTVPSAHFVAFDTSGRVWKEPHWRCLPDIPIRYKDDIQYEEHFLELLKTSVARRTGGGAPILAQLSGGMDSSTIVCISDYMRRAHGTESCDLLETVSYYDDSEPSWNERPFFTAVEAYRGKTGLHIDMRDVKPTFQSPTNFCPLLPGLDSSVKTQQEKFDRLVAKQQYRVILSGIGGDELLGGVPSPLPELSDLVVNCDLPSLVRRGIEWSLSLRKPLVHVLWETFRFSFDAYCGRSSTQRVPPWFSKKLSKVLQQGSERHPAGRLRSRLSPSAITTERTWQLLMATLPDPQLVGNERREYRFPYLDRDLVDFLIRIPNDQLVRPGRRRSLMRRAVKGLVPDVVLERRRKAFIARAPAVSLVDSSTTIRKVLDKSLLADMGYVDRESITSSLNQVLAGANIHWRAPLIRACLLEVWLKSGPPLSPLIRT